MKKEIIAGILIGLTAFIIVSGLGKIKPSSLQQTEEKPKQLEIPELEKPKPLNPEEIKDISLNKVKIYGTEYTYKRGEITRKDKKKPSENEIQKVKQLVFFYVWTLEDPLFTSPDFNKESFLKSVELLGNEEKQFKKITGRNDPLFPVSFLKTIPKASEKEEKFLSKITFENALELNNIYQTIYLEYKNQADKFVNNLLLKENKIPDTNYVFINSIVTKDFFLSDIKKLLNNSKALKKEVKDRETCLVSGLNCKRPSIYFKKQEIEFASEKTKNLLPPGVLFPNKDSSLLSKLGSPYYVKSPCWGWGENFSEINQPFYVFPDKSKVVKNNQNEFIDTLSLKLATDNYYRSLGTDSNIDKSLKKLGIKDRVPQLETSYYLCTNLEYQTKLATLYNFLNKYKNNLLFAKILNQELYLKDKSFFEKAYDFENKFFNSEPKTFENLETLSSLYAYGYKLLEDKEENQNIKKEMINRYLVINRRLSGFNLIINNAVNYFTFLFLVNKENPAFYKTDKNFYAFVYPFKSMWNLLYFPFSPSFWKAKEKPQYMQKRVLKQPGNPKEKVFMSYTETLKLYEKEEIENWHKINEKYLNSRGYYIF